MTAGRSRHQIASTDEFEEGSRVIADVSGREIAVFEYDGTYHAVANHCIHQSGPLCEGALQGRQEYNVDNGDWEWTYDDDPSVIVCPWHAWRFDITSGKNIDDDRYRVPTYDVEIDDGNVYVLL